METQRVSAHPQHPASCFEFLFILVSVLFIVPRAAYGQAPPCDPVPGQCTTVECSPPGWEIQVTVHHGDFECFKFFRQLCGESEWTLVYEGPSNSICDCGYNPSYKYRYRVERFWDLNSGTCADLCDSCTSLWWTGNGQITSCP